jgi:hypothetical protein
VRVCKNKNKKIELLVSINQSTKQRHWMDGPWAGAGKIAVEQSV